MTIPVFKFALRTDLQNDKRFLPTRATSRSTGWDVRCADKTIVLRAGQYVKIQLGFRTICPPNWWLELKPRSSTFTKKALHCLYGTIDSDYRGNMIFAAQYIPDVNALGKDLVIEFGEALGQLVPVKLQEMQVEEINNNEFDEICAAEENERGAGGFGSTSK